MNDAEDRRQVERRWRDKLAVEHTQYWLHVMGLRSLVIALCTFALADSLRDWFLWTLIGAELVGVAYCGWKLYREWQ